ncbi:hypothetical protein HDU91_006617 [Kappamyces sp. JEL0680]|nr:hypothetical protein HDU91_006617 [Kappamyces sp. JEL0680]
MVQDPDRFSLHVVVIGLGMTGIALVEKLFAHSPKLAITVSVFGEEPFYAYNRVGLTEFFSHQNLQELMLVDDDFYHKHSPALTTTINTQITAIDPAAKTVTATSSIDNSTAKHSYDILVVATGSDAVLPYPLLPPQGSPSTGVYSYRTISDLMGMMDFAKKCRKPTRALVIGGGLLGLEAAHAVKSLNTFGKVEIIQRSGWLLSRQLDQQAGVMVNEAVENLGIDVRVDARLKEILWDQDLAVSGVLLDDGTVLECELICFAIGIKPRDELARQAGIKTHPRGGIIVDKFLETSASDVYAIGECACFEDATFGLIAPGIEMATVLSKNLQAMSTAKAAKDLVLPSAFKTPDLSTKLKLLGIDVASFGDYFADRDGPKSIPGMDSGAALSPDLVKALVYKDPFTTTYKKYIFTADQKYLLGGMMIGDTSEYIKLLAMVKSGKPLDIPASQLMIGLKKDGDDGGLSDLPDEAQICSCMNVTKGQVVSVVKNGSCKSVADIKKCTKAGTQCGGCAPLVQSIFESTMKELGAKISNALCVHFPYSRTELFHIISVRQLKTFESVMKQVGQTADALGCAICKPAVASIFASLWNEHVMNKPLIGLQDTNDKYLGNIQRNGTYSVVPRIPAGEITPEKLIVLGEIAKKYNLYTKITGGQRIDLFGAHKQDLPDIWEALVAAGFESGHAYGKSLRTVKSCVGSSWCRFGQGDSVGMAIAVEERYKSIRSPHKIKGAVSGYDGQLTCAEAQSKDFGLIATEKGYNIYICGNGGSVPKHALLLIADCPPENVVPILDRFMMFYIRTADRLQRTARWLEKLPGGIEYLKEVLLHDSLGINAELERQMNELVGSFFDEWREVVESPEKRLHFKQFANTTARVDTIEIVTERGQSRPANWPKSQPANQLQFKSQDWSTLAWTPVLHKDKLLDSPNGSSCAVLLGDTQLAVYKAANRYFCSQSMCPHKRAFVLHDGILGDDGKGNVHVACPLHKREFNISSHPELGGTCSDPAMSIATFDIEERADGMLWALLPPQSELDAALGTSVWIVKSGEFSDQLQGLDLIGRPLVRKAIEPLEPSKCSNHKLEW